eukprot:g6990.t1
MAASRVMKNHGWQKYVLTVAYNGTNFHGVTPQPGVQTIMPHIQNACEKFVGKGNVKELTFSSRTDAGVHAFGNTAHVYLRHRKKQVGEVVEPHDNLTTLRGLNFYLHDGEIPTASSSSSSKTPEINLVNVNAVSDDFHVRHSAEGRTYMYYIRNPLVNCGVGNIFDNHLVWTLATKRKKTKNIYNPSEHLLNLQAMNTAALQFIGEFDFSAFQSSGCQSSSAIRDMKEIKIVEKIHYRVDDNNNTLFDELYKQRVSYLGNANDESSVYLKNKDMLNYNVPIMQEIIFKIHASSFVYNQVRNMVGYFVAVGQGIEDPIHACQILKQKKRLHHIIKAPPNGLALSKVHYNEDDLNGSTSDFLTFM